MSTQVKEFESIIKPQGRILFLGTPQTEMSLYNELPKRGYKLKVWTARYPSLKQLRSMSKTLASTITKTWHIDKVGFPTDPNRFDFEDLREREASYGKSGFNLQFMIDTTLTDEDKYPLKLSDLVVMSTNPDKAPEKIIWASSPELRDEELPCVGLHLDAYYRPMQTQGEWLDYQGAVMSIDPSGRGKDETAFAVVKMFNGNLFLTDSGGLVGGYTDKTLQGLADIAKKEKVKLILVEENYGGGMFSKLLLPFIHRTYPVTLEEVRHTTSKEKRILDVLEPLIQQHRLIINRAVVLNDYHKTQELYSTDQALRYQLFYQMSRLSRDKGSLAFDDRLDVLAMACAYWVEQLARDQELAMKQRKDDLQREALDHFLDHQAFTKPVKNKWF